MIERIVSLGELMRDFSANSYTDICDRLSRLCTVIETNAQFTRPNRLARTVQDDCDWLIEDALSLGGAVVAGARRLRSQVAATSDLSSDHAVETEAAYVRKALIDAMAECHFIQLDSQEIALLRDEQGFGTKVDEVFPDAAFDIREAQQCLAFGRHTGCVFHLGRVAELTAVTIGQAIGYASPKPGFGEVLKSLDRELERARNDYPKASKWLKGRVEVYATVVAQMHAANTAWRGKVAHLDRKYDRNEAERIYNTTKTLVQYWAEQFTPADESK